MNASLFVLVLVGMLLPCVVPQTNDDEVCRINLAVVVDRSGSISKDFPGIRQNWEDVKTFVRNVLDSLTIGEDDAYFGVVAFSERAKVEIPFNGGSKAQMDQALRTLFYDYVNGGRTNTNAGLKMASEELFTSAYMNRREVANIILLLTDGKATPVLNTDLTTTVEQVKSRGIRIIGVGISQAIDEDELRAIVSDPTTDYYTIGNFAMLSQLLANITAAVCTQPTSPPCEIPSTIYTECNYCQPTCENPNPVCPDECNSGCLCPEERPILINDTRCGRFEECEIEPCKIDLAIVLDESGSISKDSTDRGGPDYWPTMRTFIINIINSLDIGFLKTRVGLVMFANNARMIFDMQSITSKVEFERAVLDIGCKCYSGGRTNTSGALMLAKERLLVSEGGDRPNVTNVVLLVTDGADNLWEDRLISEADRIKSDGTQLIAVGVSNQTNEARLMQIVSDENSYYPVTAFEQLTSILDNLILKTCAQEPREIICPAPAPPENIIAFHSYSSVPSIPVQRQSVMRLEMTYTNEGDHYSTTNGRFTCPCKGLYYFEYVHSGVEGSFGAAIMKDNMMISGLALVSAHGSMSTSAVNVCDAGEEVYVQSWVVGNNVTAVPGTFADMPLITFKGYMIHPMA